MLFDSHCHLDDHLLRKQLAAVLTRARTAGVTGFLVPGIAPEGWPDIAAIAAEEQNVLAAYGIHPMHADRATPAALNQLAELAPSAAAIGEIGLDYTLPIARNIQQAAFRAQLRIARAAAKPVLIHCRKAFQDILAILREEQVSQVGGVMHAFSGSIEVARQCLALGLVISVGGAVTYHNAVRPLEIARHLPLDALVLETDAPDMSPEPNRGRINEPAFLIDTARRVAELRGITLAELAQITTRTALSLFIPVATNHS